MGWKDAPEVGAQPAWMSAPEVGAPAAEGSRARAQKQSDGILTKALTNLIPGAIRGAGSIGATLLAPIDMGEDAVNAAMGTSAGAVPANQQRRADMDAALTTLGADPTDPGYRLGKVGAEVAGTLGVGGAVANAARPVLGAAAPNLLNAIRTGGMSAGSVAPGVVGGATNALTRATGGAINGGLSAGAVNPADAGTGATVGLLAPGATQLAGAAGKRVGNLLRGPEQSPELAAAITSARDAGYVIPPTQARPTLPNRLLEGFSGKITTAQNASAKNQAVTNKLAAEAVGLPADAKITPDALKSVRDTAGQAYEAISGAGTITPGQTYADALDKIAAPHLKAAQGFPNAKASPVLDLVESLRSPSFDAGSAVAKIKELRSAADDAFRAGNTDVARASKAAARALEDAIEGHLAQTGNQAMLQEFRAAREQIAKTYSVEKAMNPTTGSIDSRKLAAQLARGKPLSGGLKDAADFAARFPKAAQTVESMGSLPQTSPLDWAVGGSMSAATANPLLMAGVAARPMARAAVLSPFVQNRLIQPQGPNALGRLGLSLDPLNQLGYRAAPVLAADR